MGERAFFITPVSDVGSWPLNELNAPLLSKYTHTHAQGMTSLALMWDCGISITLQYIKQLNLASLGRNSCHYHNDILAHLKSEKLVQSMFFIFSEGGIQTSYRKYYSKNLTYRINPRKIDTLE